MASLSLIAIAGLIPASLLCQIHPEINPHQNKSQQFSPASPESQGVSSESLRSLARTVGG